MFTLTFLSQYFFYGMPKENRQSVIHIEVAYHLHFSLKLYLKLSKFISSAYRGWSGSAMVLGKLPVPGRPTIWITVGQGPTALAVGAGGAFWAYLLSSIFSLLFLPLSGRRSDID